jgi:hypothetical protein
MLTEEPKMIKLTKISVDMNRVMLKRFFDNAIECGGKVVELTVNSKERFAIVTFDTSAGMIIYFIVPSVQIIFITLLEYTFLCLQYFKEKYSWFYYYFLSLVAVAVAVVVLVVVVIVVVLVVMYTTHSLFHKWNQ